MGCAGRGHEYQILPSFYFFQESLMQSTHHPLSDIEEHPALWADLGLGPGSAAWKGAGGACERWKK